MNYLCKFLSNSQTVAPAKRLKTAFKIRSQYLVENSTGRTTPFTSASLFRQLPTGSGVTKEYVTKWRDYVRVKNASSRKHNQSSPFSIPFKKYATIIPTDPDTSIASLSSSKVSGLNAILVSGAPVIEVLELIERQAAVTSTSTRSTNANALAASIVGDAAVSALTPTVAPSTDSNYINLHTTSSSSSVLPMPSSVPMSAVSSSTQDPPRAHFPLHLRPPIATSGSVSSAGTGSGPGGALFLSRTLFDTLDTIVYNYLEELLFDDFRSSSTWEKYWQLLALAENQVREDDFTVFRVLGRGGFGLVSMCKRAQSGKLFAMKVMNKKRVKLKKSEALCLNERNLLAAVDSPFVVCLKFAFTTPTDLYLIVDLMMGGDLGFHLKRKTRFPINEAKYFAARTLMGVLALHDKDIIYRDLKPENILMDNDGYTRISDLGLATYITKNGLTGTCGTRGYWPPEMLRRDAANKREKYHKQADFFSFGCVVYEFIVG